MTKALWGSDSRAMFNFRSNRGPTQCDCRIIFCAGGRDTIAEYRTHQSTQATRSFMTPVSLYPLQHSKHFDRLDVAEPAMTELRISKF